LAVPTGENHWARPGPTAGAARKGQAEADEATGGSDVVPLFAHGIGLEFVPLLVLALAVAGAGSVVAFFAGFFHRLTARACAVAALAADACFAFVILAGNRWSLDSLLRVLLTPTPLIGVVYGSALLALVAAFAPLRREGRPATGGEQQRGRPRWALFALACLAAMLAVGYGVAQFAEGHRGERKTAALLAADPDVRVERFQIDHQQRRVVCTDPEVLRYLEERFRRNDRGAGGGGVSYRLTLRYETGGTHAVETTWADDGDFSLSLSDDDGFADRVGVALARPRPAAVDELVEFLDKDWKEVKGTVLILEAGGTRRERDESLVAE
jgi:hypothetical protein